MAQVTITQLPQAGSLDGTELVPIVQNGVTVHTTTGDIAVQPTQQQTFLTVDQELTLPNSRYMAVDPGLSLSDGGAVSFLKLSMTGTAASLNNASGGIIVKDTPATVVARQIDVGSGLSVANADGTGGNPTLGLSGIVGSIEGIGNGYGFFALNGTTALLRQIYGTADQIDVSYGSGLGNPTFSIASNPKLPGTGAVTIPIGTTAQRPVGTDGKIRYNTDTNAFEVYSSGAWASLSTVGSAVTNVTATSPVVSSGGTTPNISMPAASGSSSGYLTSTDWTNFNNKGSGTVTSVTGSGNIASSGGATPNITFTGTLPVANGGTGTTTPSLVAGTNVTISGTWPNQTINASGGGGSGTVTSVDTGTGLTGGPITTSGTISLANTAVTPGTYTAANITVDAQGRITAAANGSGGGGGTVTSVGQSFTGGLISVSGSPITTSGTLALTVAGTSGGIPYFSSASTWDSSAALAANAIVIGGGAGAAPATTTTGTGVVTAIGNAVDTTGGFTTTNGAATLTNKRIDPRVSSTTSTASITPDVSAYDQYCVTAQAATLTINAPTGTPVDGDKLIFRILDNGSSQTLTWNATFTAIGVTLPTSTTISKTTYVGCIYNANNTRWDVVAVTTQA